MPFSLGDSLKNVLLAGVGAAAVTVEKGREIIDELVKKGELTVEQGKVLNEELKRQVKEKGRGNADSTEHPAADSLLDQINAMDEEQLAALKAKIAAREAGCTENSHEAGSHGE